MLGQLASVLRRHLESYAQRYQVDLFRNGGILAVEGVDELAAELIQTLQSPGFPTVKYDFSVIDVDVVGSIYEQYLRLRPQVRQTTDDSSVPQQRLMGTMG